MGGKQGEGKGREVNKRQKDWEKKVTRRNEGSKKKKKSVSMKEKGAGIEMGTEGRTDIQRLWNVREKSVKRER